jgi:hypothetical protein
MNAQHLQLTIDRDGVDPRVHHFCVADLSEVAGYVHNAVDLFFQDHPDATPVHAPIILKLAKSSLSDL